MLGSRKTLKHEDTADWHGFLEKGVRVEGEFESPGTLHLNCLFKGQLRCQRGIILGKDSHVEGEVEATEVSIGGQFTGKVKTRRRVEILEGGVLVGEVQTPCLVIAPGGVFQGTCQLSNAEGKAQGITIPIRSAVRAE